MELAHVEGERRRPARTGERGVCPCCNAETIAKCGEIVTWHWAHKGNHDCDPWSEPESEWHAHWKSVFADGDPKRMEVVIGPHRADAVTPGGVVIEIQRSPISPAEIREREVFYTANAAGMVWVFPAKHPAARRVAAHRFLVDDNGVLSFPFARTDVGIRPSLAADTAALVADWMMEDDRCRIRRLHEDREAEALAKKAAHEAESIAIWREYWRIEAGEIVDRHGVSFDVAVQMAMVNRLTPLRKFDTFCCFNRRLNGFLGRYDDFVWRLGSVTKRLASKSDLSKNDASWLVRCEMAAGSS